MPDIEGAEPATDPVAHAQKQLEQASKKVQQLHAQVRAGDPAVDYTAVADAEGAERFAQLRLEAAQDRAFEERQRRDEMVRQQAREELHELETVRASEVRSRLADACDRLTEALGDALTFNRQIAALTEQVSPGSRPSVRLAPVADILDAIKPVLGGPMYPGFLQFDDARHMVRAHGG